MAMEMLTIVLLFFASTANAVTTTSTQPIVWREVQTPVIRGHAEVRMKLELMSPCKVLTNATIHQEFLTKAIARCEEIYQDNVISELKVMCPKDSHISIQRPKRFLPLLPIIAWGLVSFGAIGGGFGISAWLKTNSLQEVAQEQAVRNKINDETSTRIQAQVHQMEQRQIQLLKDYTETKNTLSELKDKHVATAFAVSYVTSNILMAKQMLKDTNRLWQSRKLSASFFDYLNYSLPCEPSCPVQLGTPNYCHLTDDETAVLLNFHVPVTQPDQVVVEADPFVLYQQKGNSTCSVTYTGPKRMIVDRKVTCIRPIDTNFHQSDVVLEAGGSCPEHQDLTEKSKFFSVDRCTHTRKNDHLEFVQIKQDFNNNYIYCSGTEIIVEGVKRTCPDDIFMLPSTTSFSIAGRNYTGMKMVLSKSMTLDPGFSAIVNWHVLPNYNKSTVLDEALFGYSGLGTQPDASAINWNIHISVLTAVLILGIFGGAVYLIKVLKAGARDSRRERA